MSQTSNEGIERAIAGYGRLVEAMSAAHAPDILETNLTMAQMKVLWLLSVVGEGRMSDIAPKLGISLSTLSSHVDRLFEAGYARRVEDERDRRNVLVSLTPEGSAVLDAFQELGIRQLRRLLAHLDAPEIETVNLAIEALVAAARRLSAEGTKS